MKLFFSSLFIIYLFSHTAMATEIVKLPSEAAIVISSEEFSGAMEKARLLAQSNGCDEMSYNKIFIEEAADLKSSEVRFVLRALRRPASGPTEVVPVGEILARLVFQPPAGPKLDSLTFIAP